MHSGVLLALRQSLLYAKPWQQALVSAALLVIGLGLLATGKLVGLVLAAGGAALLAQIAIVHIRRTLARRTEGGERGSGIRS
jgi:molybdopterin/thiamine biosynthesis adenylyltransferase